jgi:hypothetical protein
MMERLDLSSNLFTDSLSSLRFDQHMPWLRYLYLNGNTGLTGTLPTKTDNMAKLNRVDICDTSISGTVPDSYAQLPLESFKAIRTPQLSGVLPAGMPGSTMAEDSPSPLFDAKSVLLGVGIGAAGVLAFFGAAHLAARGGRPDYRAAAKSIIVASEADQGTATYDVGDGLHLADDAPDDHCKQNSVWSGI